MIVRGPEEIGNHIVNSVAARDLPQIKSQVGVIAHDQRVFSPL